MKYAINYKICDMFLTIVFPMFQQIVGRRSPSQTVGNETCAVIPLTACTE